MLRLTCTTYICFVVSTVNQYNDSISVATPFYELQPTPYWSLSELDWVGEYTSETSENYVQLPFTLKNPLAQGFVFWLLLFVLVIWAWLKRDQPRRISQLIDSFFSNRFVDQWIREEGLLGSYLNIWLLLTSFVVIALGVQLMPWVPNLLGVGSEPLLVQYFWMFFGVLGLFLIRLIVIQFGNDLITSFKFSSVYIFNELLFMQATALLFFPIVLVQAYANLWSDSIYVVLIFSISSLLYSGRIIKLGILGITQTSFFPVYIILYLCTLEILPLVAIYSWLFK